MAPGPEILKRKRSRPSDWWAATPSTPQEQDELPAKKRGAPLSANAEGKGIKDAPAAGNRGKSVKGKEAVRGGENAEEDELQGKPVRRERSSGGREELIGAAGTSKITGRSGRSKEKATQDAGDDQSSPKKRGRPAAVQVGERDEVAEPSKQSKSQRRGRWSNTETEVRAVAKSTAQVQDSAKTRKRRTGAEKEIETAVEEADEDPIAPPKRRRPVKTTDAEPPVDELVGDNSARQKKKKRRSGAEILAAEALALTTTKDYAKSRTRLPIVAQEEVVPSKNVQGGRKGLRHSDAQLVELQPSPEDYQERGRLPTRRSDADLQEVAMAGPSKQLKRVHQRDLRVEVEAASSRLQSNRSGPKKGDNHTVKKRAKSSGGSTAAKRSQKSKKRTRSSITGAVEKAVPETPQIRKQGPNRQSLEEPKIRKRKEVEKRPENEPVKRRRVEKPLQDNQDIPEAEESTIYQHLQAVPHRVSRQTIEAKWEPLPSNCVEHISQILQDLHRPVVVRYNDERKRAQSSTALQMISRRLVSKISKGLPFPQGTRNHREDDFDFEKILDHNRTLEAQLTPALHANELLEAQLSKEIALLESEQENLANLEANAKSETALRNQAARKLHALLQPEDGTFAIEGLMDDVGLGIGHIPRLLDLYIQDDENLEALVQDLQGHVDSIQGNIRQVQGVTQAISKSKAAVQATLFGHLNSMQYEEVVLGAE